MLTIGVAAFVVLVAFTACSNSTSNQGDQTTSATSQSAAGTETHNQADVMFAQHMIPHHQQAIEMSDIILAKEDIDPRVTELANQIKAAQGPEIQQMQTWLTQWGQPTMPMMPGMEMPGQSATPSQTPDPHHTSTPSQTDTTSAMPGPSGTPAMPGMPSQSMMPGMSGMQGMMGMMSPQDMAALQNAKGVEATKLFLTQMIQHHQGAITMAQHEIETGQYPAAISMCRSIVISQQQEITKMQDILRSL
jgi:uncharacterized protein (DUF305 family)